MEQVPHPKLPVKAILAEAFRSPFGNFTMFLRFSSGPIAATTAAEWVFGPLAIATNRPAVFCLYSLAAIPMMFSFYVAWTRISVLGPSSVAKRGIFCFGKPERNVILALFGMVLCLVAVAISFSLAVSSIRISAVTIPLATIFILASLYGLGRMVFLFPELALQRSQGLRSTWRLTKGLVLRLALMIVVIALVYGWAGAIRSELGANFVDYDTQSFSFKLPPAGISAWMFPLSTLKVFFSYLNTATGVAAVCSAYRFVTDRSEGESIEIAE